MQWSTLATFSFFFWAIVVSFQTGKLPTLANMKTDLWFMVHPWKRGSYPKEAAFSPFIGVATAFCAVLGSLFAFEAIWVPLYDFFQFGSVWWPVYAYSPRVFIADDILPSLCFFVAAVLLPWNSMRTTKTNQGDWRLEIKWLLNFMRNWRVDAGWLCIILITFMFWAEWVIFPHSSGMVGKVLTNVGGKYIPDACYVMPSQGFFPQNTYTFYPCTIKGVSGYSILQIFGFFNPNNQIHLLNVVAKFALFASLCYPFMVKKR